MRVAVLRVMRDSTTRPPVTSTRLVKEASSPNQFSRRTTSCRRTRGSGTVTSTSVVETPALKPRIVPLLIVWFSRPGSTIPLLSRDPRSTCPRRSRSTPSPARTTAMSVGQVRSRARYASDVTVCPHVVTATGPGGAVGVGVGAA